jgi:rubrerythrin
MASYCGFLTIDEARFARDQLRAKRVEADILILAAAESDPDQPLQEEFWVRVPQSKLALTERILGFQEAEFPDEEDEREVEESQQAGEEEQEAEEGEEAVAGDGGFACSNCGRDVAEDEDVCPHCGASFEE